MIRKDFIGLYAPAAYIMMAISTLIVSLCLIEPNPTEVTGPSGSDMVCAFYYFFHLLLWLPVGGILILFHFMRHGKSHYMFTSNTSASDKTKHHIALILSIITIVIAFILMFNEPDFHVVLLLSAITNCIPALLLFGLGYLITSSRRASQPTTPSPNQEQSPWVLFLGLYHQLERWSDWWYLRSSLFVYQT